MPVVLTLGPITFADFEIPQKLPFGGSQMLVVKKLVGGDRVIDAMGRDDGEKQWAGQFRGPLAETRARQLDFLRIQGQPLLLAWSTLRFLVVIDKYEAVFEQPFEIPYSISCTVLTDLSAPILPPQPDIDSSIFGDITGAGNTASQINLPAIVSAVASVASLANAVAKFSGASATQVAGLQPQALAAQLSGQSAAFQQLGQLYQLQAQLGRTSINVANAGS
jgi:hypothetical protein